MPDDADNGAASGSTENLAFDEQSQGTPTVESCRPIYAQLDTLAYGQAIVWLDKNAATANISCAHVALLIMRAIFGRNCNRKALPLTPVNGSSLARR